VCLRKEFALAIEEDHDFGAHPVIVVRDVRQPEKVLVELATGLHCRKDRRAES
jgi:hypothetical protein